MLWFSWVGDTVFAKIKLTNFEIHVNVSQIPLFQMRFSN